MPSRQLVTPESASGSSEFGVGQASGGRTPLVPIVCAGGAAFLCLILLSVLCCRISQRRRKGDRSTCDAKLHRFSYKQLRRATASFSPKNKLGQGGFGSVFRGTLDSGQIVAVKLMDSGSVQGEREFQNELSLAEKLAASESVVALLGFCSDRKDRRLLVYEFMHNGSLQDALIDRKCTQLMNWELRFSIALDVAKGLRFLHTTCNPPIIHGDIKPSNVLLDLHFTPKIADFGLSRLKSEIEAEAAAAAALDLNADMGSASGRKRWGQTKTRRKEAEASADVESESVATLEEGKEIRSPDNLTSFFSPDAADVSEDNLPESALEAAAEASPSDMMEKTSVSEACFDKLSVDSGGNRRVDCRKKSLSGRDWWWKQDAGSESAVRDYVMEWIGTEIKKEPQTSGWMGSCGDDHSGGDQSSRRRKHKKLDWWASIDTDSGGRKKQKHRQAREWWREEFCEELAQKSRKKKKKNRREGEDLGENWWEQDDSDSGCRKTRWSGEWWMNSFSGELRIGRKSVRRTGDDVLKSGWISSTPSMRGTVCYVAPEYGGGGMLTEKSDVYSYGVLLLVIISGRRPLQVTASPMAEFERANLISWSRHLAHTGRLLELIDPNLKSFNREQALLCITVALLCLQRSPTRRPTITEVVKMLSGDVDPPHLPAEFSPSPPSGCPFKSSRKKRSVRNPVENRDPMPPPPPH